MRRSGTLDEAVNHNPVTGEPLLLRTAAGNPYGLATITKESGGNATDQTPYTFKQGIQDRTTGWIHYGARYYDPGTGRWTQQDTLDTPLNPANANRYAYAANNPINNSDPSGRDATDVVSGVLGAFVGAALGGLVVAATGETGVGAVAGVVAGGCAAGIVTQGIERSLRGGDAGQGLGTAADNCVTGIASKIFG
jgi:RHS repeat-associated protein